LRGQAIQSNLTADVECGEWNAAYEWSLTVRCELGSMEVVSVRCVPRLAIILATDIAEASAEGFRLTFRGQLASALGAALERIAVVDVQAASVVVYFYIAEDNEPGGVSTATLMDQLQQRVDSGSMQQFMPEFLRYEPQPGVDTDSDGVINALDHFPLDASEQLDTDGDNIGDAADTDDDGDGFADAVDAFPLDASEHVDTDWDGVGNEADTDDDGDSVLDSDDFSPLDASVQHRPSADEAEGSQVLTVEKAALLISAVVAVIAIAGCYQSNKKVDELKSQMDGAAARPPATPPRPSPADVEGGGARNPLAQDAPATCVAVSNPVAGAVDAVPTPPPRVLSNSSVLASGGSSLPAAAASPPSVREVAPARPDATPLPRQGSAASPLRRVTSEADAMTPRQPDLSPSPGGSGGGGAATQALQQGWPEMSTPSMPVQTAADAEKLLAATRLPTPLQQTSSAMLTPDQAHDAQALAFQGLSSRDPFAQFRATPSPLPRPRHN
jgi:hypothetical protein